MQVSAIMTKKLITAEPDLSLSALRDIYSQSKFQHIPVLDTGRRLVGIVSVKDYFKLTAPISDSASEKTLDIFLNSRKIKHVMSSPVISVSADCPVVKAAALLLKHNIGCLPVTDADDLLLGLVSWKDIMRVVVLQAARRSRLAYGSTAEAE
jgi:acetoin utilization protein AcuB